MNNLHILNGKHAVQKRLETKKTCKIKLLHKTLKVMRWEMYFLGSENTILYYNCIRVLVKNPVKSSYV